MGVEVEDAEALDSRLCGRNRQRGQVLAERNPVAEADLPLELALRFPTAAPQHSCSWRVQLEDGSFREGGFAPAQLPEGPMDEAGQQPRLLALDALPAGYHRIELQGEDWSDSVELI